MYLQRIKGPRFLIPYRFRPYYFNYIRVFRDTADLESNTLTNVAPDASDECVICMHSLRFTVDS